MANFLEQYQNNKSLLEEEKKRKKSSILNPNSTAYKENTKTEDFLTKYGASPSSNGASSSDDDFLSKYLSADTKSIYEEMAKLNASSETETLQSESNGEKGLLQKIPYISDALGGGITGIGGIAKTSAEIKKSPLGLINILNPLKTPVNIIKGAIKGLKDGDNVLESVKDGFTYAMDKNADSSQKLVDVADGIIDYGEHFSTIDENSGFVEKALKGAVTSAGQMASSSIIPIPYAGLAMSSTGTAIHEGQEAGVKNPYLYGLINGTIETGSEMVLPGSKVLKGVYAGKGIKEAIKEVAKEFGEETVEQSLKTIAKTMAKEGAQEGLTEVAQGFAGNMFEDAEGNKMGFNSTEELVNNIMLAGVSGAIMGGVGDASAYIKSKSTTTDSETGIKSSIFDSKKKKEAQEIAKEAIKEENDNINNLLSTIRTETTENGEEVHVSENGNTINPVLMSAMTETYNEIYGIDINESVELNNKIAKSKAQDEDLQWNSYLDNAETENLQLENDIQTENLQSNIVDENKNINPNIKSVEEEVNAPITNINSNAEISPVEKSLDNTDKVVSSQTKISSNEEIEALNTINNSISDEYVKENGIEKTISEIDTVINSIPNTKENETYINALNSKKTELAENYNQSKAKLSENKETESKNTENNQNKKNSPEINENNGNLKELERVKNRAEKKLLNPKAKENTEDVKIEENKKIEEVDNKSKTSEENKNKSKENEINQNKEKNTEETKTNSSSKEEKLKKVTESNDFKKHYEGVELKPSEKSDTSIRSVEALGKALGKDVVFFKGDNKTSLQGFMKDNTLYINDSNTVNGMMTTLGHETFHTLKESHTETFNELVKWGEENFTSDEIERFLAKVNNESLVEEYINNPSLLSEEMLAETFGNDFSNKEFWSRIQKKNKSLFEKIKDVISNIFDILTGKDVDFLTKKHIHELRGKFVDIFGKFDTYTGKVIDRIDTKEAYQKYIAPLKESSSKTEVLQLKYDGESVLISGKMDNFDSYMTNIETLSKNKDFEFLKDNVNMLNSIIEEISSEIKGINKDMEGLPFKEKIALKKERINALEKKYNVSGIINDAYLKLTDTIPDKAKFESSLNEIVELGAKAKESVLNSFTKHVTDIANMYGYNVDKISESMLTNSDKKTGKKHNYTAMLTNLKNNHYIELSTNYNNDTTSSLMLNGKSYNGLNKNEILKQKQLFELSNGFKKTKSNNSIILNPKNNEVKFRDIAKTEEDKKVISKEVAKETFKRILNNLDNYRLREAINKTLEHKITSKGNLKEILNDGAIDVAFNTDFSYGSRRGAIMAYLIQDHSFSVGDALAVANYITDLAEDTIMASNNIHGVPNHIAYKPKADETFEDKKMKVQAKFIDNLAAIKLVSDKSYNLALLSRLNYGKVGNLFDSDVLVDIEGNVVLDYGWKTIDEDFKTGDSEEQIAYRNYLTFKSALERFNKGVPSLAKDDGTFYSSRELQFEIRNAELQYPRFIESSERLYKFMDSFGKEYIVKTGLMSEEEFKLVRMSDPSWVPFVRDGEEGISFGYGRSKKGLANQKAAIERIKGSKDSVQDVYGSLVGYIEKTVTSSMKNKAVQSIAHELLINPNLSEFGEVITNTNLVDLNDPKIITCMMDGQKAYLKINNEHLLNSLTSLDEMEIHKMLKPLEKMVKLFKSWTTSDNPLFAFTNTFKDHFTYLANSDTNLAKAEKYVFKAAKELATNGEIKQLYDRMGISGSHYTADSVVNKVEKMQKQKHIYKDGKLIDIVEKHPVLKGLDTFLGGVEKLNYNSEAVHRLAKFMMSIEDGKSVEQATLDAMEITTNFSRRGNYVKGLTLISPYVNAAIQGNVRKFNQFFTSKERTAQTLINLAIIGVITHALEYGLLDDDDKEKRKAISEYTRYSNYLIPVGNGKFAKIPKSREYGVMFDSIFEMISDKGFGEGITTALKMDYQNSAPDFQNFFLKPLLDTIGTNDNATDFLGRDIIPYDLKGLSSNRQIAEDTTMGSRIIGQLTSLAGISPVELDYLIDQYTGIVGDVYLTNGKISKGIDLITKKVSVNSDNYSPKRTEYYENKAVLTDVMKVLEQDGDEKTLEKVKKINSEYTKTNKKAKEYLAKGDKEKSEALYEKLNEKYADVIAEYKKETKNISTKLILNPKSKG